MHFPSVLALLLSAAATVTAVRRSSTRPRTIAYQDPIEPPQLGRFTSQGCFASLGDVNLVHTHKLQRQFNSPGTCLRGCEKSGRSVGVLHNTNCFCMDVYPPTSLLVPDDLCDAPCPGYIFSACGGQRVYSVYNLGVTVDVAHQEDPGELMPPTSPWKEAVERLGELWEAAGEIGSSTLSGMRGATSTSVKSPLDGVMPPQQEPARDIDDPIEL